MVHPHPPKKDNRQTVTGYLANTVLKINKVNLSGHEKQFKVYAASDKIQAFKQNLKLRKIFPTLKDFSDEVCSNFFYDCDFIYIEE